MHGPNPYAPSPDLEGRGWGRRRTACERTDRYRHAGRRAAELELLPRRKPRSPRCPKTTAAVAETAGMPWV